MFTVVVVELAVFVLGGMPLLNLVFALAFAIAFYWKLKLFYSLPEGSYCFTMVT